jgi:3-oxoacyl-[acyl-carrier-protein] synthase-3
MTNAYIRGAGMYVPETVITNQDLVERFGIDTSHDWIVQRTGIEERRFTPAGMGPSDLALRATEQALERAGLERDDIDLIVFATISPEHMFPGSGVYLQEKLGLPGVPAMDLRNQCSGFLYGLYTASAAVKAGMAKNVLLVGAEIHSAGLDLSTRGRQLACLFGDGAGAVIVSGTEDEARGLRWISLGADGRYSDELMARVWDTRKRPMMHIDEDSRGIIPTEDVFPYMNGKVVFKHAVEKMVTSIVGMCWENQVEVSDVDLFFFHQANLRIATVGWCPARRSPCARSDRASPGARPT